MTLENMIQLCNNLTPVENEIAHYILTNKESVSHLSIQELAEIIYVSKSAIHRFCKKIKLNGFNELKVQLAQDFSDYVKDKEVIDVNYPFEETDNEQMIASRLMKLYETTIHDTYDYMDPQELREIAKLLYDANTVDIYTHSHNMNAAENFRDKMLTIGRAVNCPKSFYEQRLFVLGANSNHVALILSYSGKATYIPPLVKMLHDKRIPIILIGKAGSNLYPEYISHHLYISGKENLRDRISQFSSHIALQYMLDVVFGCIYNLDRKKNINYLHRAIGFMDDRDIKNE